MYIKETRSFDELIEELKRCPEEDHQLFKDVIGVLLRYYGQEDQDQERE